MTFPRRTLWIIGAVLVLAGCAGVRRDAAAPGAPVDPSGDGVVRTRGCATATSPPAMSIDGTPQPANQNALSAIAGQIQPRAEKDFADVYAGVRLVQERDRIQVFRKPSADFDRWIVRDFAADCVEVLDARYSARELRAMQDRIEADMDHWRQRGIRVNTIGADFVRGVIVVGTQDEDRARQELPARYGSGIPIDVEHQEPLGW
jgi:hypothetical protein